MTDAWNSAKKERTTPEWIDVGKAFSDGMKTVSYRDDWKDIGTEFNTGMKTFEYAVVDFGNVGKAFEKGMNTFEYEQVDWTQFNKAFDAGINKYHFADQYAYKDPLKEWGEGFNTFESFYNSGDWVGNAFSQGAAIGDALWAKFKGQTSGAGTETVDDLMKKYGIDNLDDLAKQYGAQNIDDLLGGQALTPALNDLNDTIGNLGTPSVSTPKVSAVKLPNSVSKIPSSLDTIAKNTSQKQQIDISQEQLRYLRDIAERNAINKYTSSPIKVNMTNNNNISNGMDLDGIVDGLGRRLVAKLQEVRAGV